MEEGSVRSGEYALPWFHAKGFELLHEARSPVCEDFRTPRANIDRMLKLSTEVPIGGHRGPVVIKDSTMRDASVDHGLDREDHSLSDSLGITSIIVVNDMRWHVKNRADSVAREVFDHTVATLLRSFADDSTNLVELFPRLNDGDRIHHRPISVRHEVDR